MKKIKLSVEFEYNDSVDFKGRILDKISLIPFDCSDIGCCGKILKLELYEEGED